MKAVFLVIVLLFELIVGAVIDNRVDVDYNNYDDVCNLPDSLKREIQAYQPVVNKLINEITKGKFKGKTWEGLADLVDRFGNRMTGSQSLEDAIDYVVSKMKEGGLENVHNENATAPCWKRGFESATLVSPHKQNLNILGLGTTVGTPRGGIIGEVIVVESFVELSTVPDELVKGKIVVFVPQWESYGKTVVYRGKSAVAAAKKGAIAALVRSVTPFSINSPHTGMQHYAEGVTKIPVASVTVEDAEMLLRMYRKKMNLQIRLEMADRNCDDVTTRNTIGELQGKEFKDKNVVVVSGHLDSWDVGVGAMDDGGGAMISWKAVEFLTAMGLRPRRTIRSILWTAEEQGLFGAYAYQEAHKANEAEEFNFFFESDIGTFEPRGLDFSGNADAECIFKEVLQLFKVMNASEFNKPTDGGPDISWWTDRGFPGASLLNKNEKYFWYHHSDGDRMSLEDTDNLDKCAALWASAAFVIADLSVDIPKTIKNHYEIPKTIKKVIKGRKGS